VAYAEEAYPAMAPIGFGNRVSPSAEENMIVKGVNLREKSSKKGS